MATNPEGAEPQPGGAPICGPPLPWDCSIFDAVKKDANDVASSEAPPEGSAILPPFVAAAGTDTSLRVDASPEAGMGDAMAFTVLLGCVVILVALVRALDRRVRRRKAVATTLRGPG